MRTIESKQVGHRPSYFATPMGNRREDTYIIEFEFNKMHFARS